MNGLIQVTTYHYYVSIDNNPHMCPSQTLSQHIIIAYEFLLIHTSTHINPHGMNYKTFPFIKFSTQQILRGKQAFSKFAKHLR